MDKLKCFADGGLFRLTGTASILPFAEPADGRKDGKPKRRFALTAYSGDKVNHPWDGPVVIDLDTLEFKSKLPTLFNHRQDRIVGYSDQITRTADQKLSVGGVLFAWKDDVQEIIDNAEAGYEWQVSVGLGRKSDTFSEFLSQNQTSTVNGRQVFGPCYIIRNAVLRENSFCVLGVDDNTSAMVFAQPLPENMKGEKMALDDKTPASGQSGPEAARIAELEKTAKFAIIEAAEARSGLTFGDDIREGLEKLDVDGLKTFTKVFSMAVAALGKLPAPEPAKKDFSQPTDENRRGMKVDPQHFRQTMGNDTTLKDNPPADGGPEARGDALQLSVLAAAKKLAADDAEQRKTAR